LIQIFTGRNINVGHYVKLLKMKMNRSLT